MCANGNGSIYRQCRDAILAKHTGTSMPNKEMRRILEAHGGCMVDKPKVAMLKS
jgi:hypothetical protein